jgi:hypothetical protein
MEARRLTDRRCEAGGVERNLLLPIHICHQLAIDLKEDPASVHQRCDLPRWPAHRDAITSQKGMYESLTVWLSLTLLSLSYIVYQSVTMVPK